jgi:hypothetical protein
MGWVGGVSASVAMVMPEVGGVTLEGRVGSGNSSGSSGQPNASLVLTYALTESIIVMPAGSLLDPTLQQKNQWFILLTNRQINE